MRNICPEGCRSECCWRLSAIYLYNVCSKHYHHTHYDIATKEEEYFFNPSDSIFNSSLNIAGTNQTLDLITWNIENFPKNNLTNLYVKQIIDSLNVDIIAMQEITDMQSFNNILDSLGNKKC